MTTDREHLARRLSLGWQETAAELCSNVWFGDAERVDRDGRDAFARTVAPALGIDAHSRRPTSTAFTTPGPIPWPATTSCTPRRSTWGNPVLPESATAQR